MKKLFLLIFVLSIIFFTGCWDKVEMDDRNYVITLGVDKFSTGEKTEKLDNDETEKRFSLSLGVADIQNKNKNSGNEAQEKEEKKNTVEILSGASIPSTMSLADMYNSKKVYYGQLKTVVFGEELLKDSELFKETLDALERNHEINMKIIVLAAKDKASDNLEVILNTNSSSGMFIWDFYKNSANDIAVTKKMDLENLLINLRRSGNAIIPVINHEDDKIRLGGSAVIKDYELCGYLTDMEERGNLWVYGLADGALVDCKLNESYIPVAILKNSSKLKFSEEEGRLVCRINVYAEGSVEANRVGDENLFDSQTLEDIQFSAENIINEEIANTIKITQSVYNADVMNLMEELKKWNYKLYLKYSDNLEESFMNMKIVPKAEVKIKSIGVIK